MEQQKSLRTGQRKMKKCARKNISYLRDMVDTNLRGMLLMRFHGSKVLISKRDDNWVWRARIIDIRQTSLQYLAMGELDLDN